MLKELLYIRELNIHFMHFLIWISAIILKVSPLQIRVIIILKFSDKYWRKARGAQVGILLKGSIRTRVANCSFYLEKKYLWILVYTDMVGKYLESLYFNHKIVLSLQCDKAIICRWSTYRIVSHLSTEMRKQQSLEWNTTSFVLYLYYNWFQIPISKT